jgi:N-acetylmuramoyl-L-alanine amidase
VIGFRKALFSFSLLLILGLPALGGVENLGNSPGGGGILSLDEALSLLGRGKEAGFSAQAPPGIAEFRWDPLLGAGVISSSSHRLSFQTGRSGERGFFLLDGKDLYPVPLPYLSQGSLYFPEDFVTLAERVLFPPAEQLPLEESGLFRIAAIIVDPGHGGKDPGAIGKFNGPGGIWSLVEKEITLKVSREVHALLSHDYPGKRILLTRDRDSSSTLADRTELANSVPLEENEAVIFISIHANSSLNKRARGFEVWYLDPEYRRELIDKSKYGESAAIVNRMIEEEYTTESILMGRNILNRIEEELGDLVPNRGLKAEKWFVVRNAQMPAVLVELPFVSNQEDAEIMAEDRYLKRFAAAIYKGIVDFVTAFERTGGFTAIQ